MITKAMKRILTISVLFLLAISFYILAIFNPKPIWADEASCQAHGGVCQNLSCPSGYESVSDERELVITCTYNQVCCRLIPDPDNQCTQAGGECFSSSPNPTLYRELSQPCPDSSQGCYRSIFTPCTSPNVCTYSPGGQCPGGESPQPGDCSAHYQNLCCPAPTTPELPTAGTTKLFCDSSGEPTSDPSITGKLYTAIGCIPVRNTNEFIGFILRWAIGIGGGIAFLLIVFAGFQIMTSAGNPERLKAGQELLTSAIAGLILLIFSVFILRIIGVNILGIFKP